MSEPYFKLSSLLPILYFLAHWLKYFLRAGFAYLGKLKKIKEKIKGLLILKDLRNLLAHIFQEAQHSLEPGWGAA